MEEKERKEREKLLKSEIPLRCKFRGTLARGKITEAGGHCQPFSAMCLDHSNVTYQQTHANALQVAPSMPLL